MRKRKALTPLDKNALLSKGPRRQADGDYSTASWAKNVVASSKTPKISNVGGSTTTHDKPPKARRLHQDKRKAFVTTRRRKAAVTRNTFETSSDTDNERHPDSPISPSIDGISLESRGEIGKQRNPTERKANERSKFEPGASVQDSGESRNDTRDDKKAAGSAGEGVNSVREEVRQTAQILSSADGIPPGASGEGIPEQQDLELFGVQSSDEDMDCSSDSGSLDLDSSPEKAVTDTEEANSDAPQARRDQLTEFETNRMKNCASDHSQAILEKQTSPMLHQDENSKHVGDAAKPSPPSALAASIQPPVTQDYINGLRSRPADDAGVLSLLMNSEKQKRRGPDDSKLVGSTIGGTQLTRSESLDGSELTFATLREAGRESMERLRGFTKTNPVRDKGLLRPPNQGPSSRPLPCHRSSSYHLESASSIEEWSIDDDSASVPIEFRVDTKRYSHPPLPPGWALNVSRSRKLPFYTHPDHGTTWYCPVVLPPKPDGVISRRTKRIKQRHGDEAMAETETKSSRFNPKLTKNNDGLKTDLVSPSDQSIPSTMSDMVNRYNLEKAVGVTKQSSFVSSNVTGTSSAQKSELFGSSDAGYDGSQSSTSTYSALRSNGWSEDNALRQDNPQHRFSSAIKKMTTVQPIEASRKPPLDSSRKSCHTESLSPIHEGSELKSLVEGIAAKMPRKISMDSAKSNTSSSASENCDTSPPLEFSSDYNALSSSRSTTNKRISHVNENSDVKISGNATGYEQLSREKVATQKKAGEQGMISLCISKEIPSRNLDECRKSENFAGEASGEKGESIAKEERESDGYSTPKHDNLVTNKTNIGGFESSAGKFPKSKIPKQENYSTQFGRLKTPVLDTGSSLSIVASSTHAQKSFGGKKLLLLSMSGTAKQHSKHSLAVKDAVLSYSSGCNSKKADIGGAVCYSTAKTPTQTGNKLCEEVKSSADYEVVGSTAHSRRSAGFEKVSLVSSSIVRSKTLKTGKPAILMSSDVGGSPEITQSGRQTISTREQNESAKQDGASLVASSTHSEAGYDDELSPLRKTNTPLDAPNSPTKQIVETPFDSLGSKRHSRLTERISPFTPRGQASNESRPKFQDVPEESFSRNLFRESGLPNEIEWKSPGVSNIDAKSCDDSYTSPLRVDFQESPRSEDAGPASPNGCEDALEGDEDLLGSSATKMGSANEGDVHGYESSHESGCSSGKISEGSATGSLVGLMQRKNPDYEAIPATPLLASNEDNNGTDFQHKSRTSSLPSSKSLSRVPPGNSPRHPRHKAIGREITRGGKLLEVPMSPNDGDVTDFSSQSDMQLPVDDDVSETASNESVMSDQNSHAKAGPDDVGAEIRIESPPSTKRFHRAVSWRVLNPPHPLCSLQTLEVLMRRRARRMMKPSLQRVRQPRRGRIGSKGGKRSKRAKSH